MRITTAQDPKVVEFLEYMGVGVYNWCQIQIGPDNIVGVEHGIGTKPSWHAERQQAALLKILESNRQLISENAKKIEAAAHLRKPPEDLEELSELESLDLEEENNEQR